MTGDVVWEYGIFNDDDPDCLDRNFGSEGEAQAELEEWELLGATPGSLIVLIMCGCGCRRSIDNCEHQGELTGRKRTT